MRRSWILKLLPVVLMVGLLAGVVAKVRGLHFWGSSRDTLLKKGYSALAQGDLPTAATVADTLEERHFEGAGHLLRGKLWLARLNRDLTRLPAVPPYEDAQEIAQLVAAGASPAIVPRAAREISLLSSALVQQPYPVVSPAQDELRKALGEFARVYDSGPLGVEASLLAATCLIKLDQRQAAAAGLTTLSQLHPNEKEPHRLLAAIYIDLNTPVKAVNELSAWAALDPEDGRPFRWIGFFFREFGLAEKSVGAYEKALQRRLNPRSRVDVIHELAEVYVATQGDYQKALQTLDRCPEQYRDDPEILALRTDCLISLGRTTEAVRLLDAILNKQADFVPALLLRGKIYLTEDQPRRALPLLEKAVRLDPFNEKNRQHLAEAYRAIGDTRRALAEDQAGQRVLDSKSEIRLLRRKSAAEPWSDEIRLRLAILCLNIDRPKDALVWLRAALACNPGNRQARRLLQRLPASVKMSGTSNLGDGLGG